MSEGKASARENLRKPAFVRQIHMLATSLLPDVSYSKRHTDAYALFPLPELSLFEGRVRATDDRRDSKVTHRTPLPLVYTVMLAEFVGAHHGTFFRRPSDLSHLLPYPKRSWRGREAARKMFNYAANHQVSC